VLKVKKKELKEGKLAPVTKQDFEYALREVAPQYGTIGKLEKYLPDKFSLYSDENRKVMIMLKKKVNTLQAAKKAKQVSVLLTGPTGVGKMSLAAVTADKSGAPMVEVVTPESLAGKSVNQRLDSIKASFIRANESKFSVVILRRIEDLVMCARGRSYNFSSDLVTLIESLVTERLQGGQKETRHCDIKE